MITDIINKLVERKDLSNPEAREAMDELMTGRATDIQVAGFLTALRMKGETADELAELARVMREKAEPLWDGPVPDLLDTCGTGGDRSGTFNISTAAAFVVAGCGIRVAKHGNRSATSLCGSADVMEKLGVDIDMTPERLRRAITDIGIGFLFAQRFHRSMKHVMPARSQLKFRTVFNLLGPLANPARPKYQVVGVPSRDVMEKVAEALGLLGIEHAFVVHGFDGLDEISLTGMTALLELKDRKIHSSTIRPEDFGIEPAPLESLLGGTAEVNAAIIEGVLRGDKGAKRNVVLMNAAAGIVAANHAPSLQEAFRIAAASIDSGAALQKLQRLREFSQS